MLQQPTPDPNLAIIPRDRRTKEIRVDREDPTTKVILRIVAHTRASVNAGDRDYLCSYSLGVSADAELLLQIRNSRYAGG